MRRNAVENVRNKVLRALGGRGDTLHELDYEDVAITEAGLTLVRRAAATVIRRLSGAPGQEMPPSRALAMFLDHVFWDERTGGLILCADLSDTSFCLPIPRDCWGIRPQLGRMQ